MNARVTFFTILSVLNFVLPSAHAGLLYSASLKNGDYGGGFQVGTYVAGQPFNQSGSTGGTLSTLGIVDAADGVTYTTRNDVINYSLGADGKDRNSFRTHGTVSVWFEADSATFDGGQPFVDNYGFNQFNTGQAYFGTGMGRNAGLDTILNTPDDRVSFGWSTWHSNTWQTHTTNLDLSQLPDFDRWHNVGFAWGGPNDFEVWVDGVLLASNDLPGTVSLPWGTTAGAYNFALGEIHERINGNNSPEGVTFADLEIWDEYRAFGNTTAIPEPSSLALLGIGAVGFAVVRRRKNRERLKKTERNGT